MTEGVANKGNGLLIYMDLLARVPNTEATKCELRLLISFSRYKYTMYISSLKGEGRYNQ